jgi:hypothetical protein
MKLGFPVVLLPMPSFYFQNWMTFLKPRMEKDEVVFTIPDVPIQPGWVRGDNVDEEKERKRKREKGLLSYFLRSFRTFATWALLFVTCLEPQKNSMARR